MKYMTCSYGQQHYDFQPRKGLPILLFSNSLGTDLTMWEPQLEPLCDHFSLLRYDTRGQGRSSMPPGPYTIDQMGRDILEMMDSLEIPSVHFCGLSMGGVIGQWLGIHAPQRLRSLILSNTAAQIGSAEGWNARIKAVQDAGLATIVQSVLERWYSPVYRDSDAPSVEATRLLLLRNDPAGYIATCAAVRDADLRGDVHRITAPTLVIAGTLDPVTTVEDANFLAAQIPGSRIKLLEAAHLSNTEAATAFNSAVLNFCQANEEIQSAYGR